MPVPTPAQRFTARFLARVPPDVAATFTSAQLTAIRRAFGMRYEAGHALDIRRHLRLPWGRFYLVLLAGRDR
jgi:hypothetical protein